MTLSLIRRWSEGFVPLAILTRPVSQALSSTERKRLTTLHSKAIVKDQPRRDLRDSEKADELDFEGWA